jgi:NAD(P)-dependent dehydrogenase (short-subunit alcohol dehydrogenase family)
MVDCIAVTGAASGVGRACTGLLLKEGYRVLACVHSEADARALEREFLGETITLVVDLQDHETIKGATLTAAKITKETGLKGLVNCAGNLYCGPLEYFPRKNWFNQYDVNVFGTMAFIQEMLPLLRTARGRIVNIGAVGSGVAMPFYGAIASSKIAFQALNDCLRRELHPFGIHVIIVEPGGIDTPANDKMRESAKQFLEALDPQGIRRYGFSMDRFTRWADRMHKRNLKPEQVAAVVLKALRARRPRTRYRIGWDSRGVALLMRLLPDRLFDLLLLRLASLPLRFGSWADK